jgi:hypothetical protein
VVGGVRSMAVEAPWGAFVRRGGATAVAVAFFEVFCGATKAASRGAGAGTRVVPHPAAIALDDCGFSGQEAGSGSSAKETQLTGERSRCTLREVDEPAGVGEVRVSDTR